MRPDKMLQNGERKDLSSDVSVMSLHGDIHNVISAMGPSTPLAVSRENDSGDEATISSNNFSHNSLSNDTSNTSFVEVIIKNHHRKSKLIRESLQQNFHKASSSVWVQTEKELVQEVFSKPSQASLKESNNRADSVDTSIREVNNSSCFKTSMFPQRFFKINKLTHRKQGTIIDLMRGQDSDNNNCFKIPFVGSTQSPLYVKRNEKKILIPEECLNTPDPEDNQGKTELYYFDRGNYSFYNTTDYPPIIMVDHLAEKTENKAIRFWSETFGMANVVLAFMTTFVLQFLRFVLFGIVRPLTAGVMQLVSDYFVKPLLAAIFNGFIQPPMIFMYNIMSSVRDVCEPIAQSVGFFLREISVIFKSLRLVEVRNNDNSPV